MDRQFRVPSAAVFGVACVVAFGVLGGAAPAAAHPGGLSMEWATATGADNDPVHISATCDPASFANGSSLDYEISGPFGLVPDETDFGAVTGTYAESGTVTFGDPVDRFSLLSLLTVDARTITTLEGVFTVTSPSGDVVVRGTRTLSPAPYIDDRNGPAGACSVMDHAFADQSGNHYSDDYNGTDREINVWTHWNADVTTDGGSHHEIGYSTFDLVQLNGTYDQWDLTAQDPAAQHLDDQPIPAATTYFKVLNQSGSEGVDPAPAIQVRSQREVDFGTVPNGAVRFGEFLFENRGSADLIADVSLSGGDGQIEFDPFACGETFVPTQGCGFGIRYTATQGPVHATITIASNDPDEPVIHLEVTGSSPSGATPTPTPNPTPRPSRTPPPSDQLPPVVATPVLSPTTVNVGASLTVTSTAADSGGVVSAAVFFSPSGNAVTAMSAADGAFGGASEDLTATLDAPLQTGSYQVCVAATDGAGNVSDGTACAPLTVSKLDQTITFVDPGTVSLAQSPIALSASASSGLAVTLVSRTRSVCTVAGSSVTLLTAGTCSINADQAGDSAYNPAPRVQRNFLVTSPESVAPTVTRVRVVPAHGVPGTPIALTATTADASGAARATFTVGPSASSFVGRTGTQLTLAGLPFAFSGLNFYPANNTRDNGCTGTHYGEGNLLGTSLDQWGTGMQVMRSWFFQPLAQTRVGPGATRDWSAFDHTLSVAAAHGLKVIATLTDNWGECGDGGLNGTKSKAWYTAGYRTTADDGLIEPYRDWVRDVVTRYRDDPRIAFWQLVNEAEIRANDGSCPAGNHFDDILHDFAADVSGLIKSIDAVHLVSLGTLGDGQCGTEGDQYRVVHAVPTIDLCEYHDYTQSGQPGGDQFNGFAVRLSQCNALNKPLFVGESGLRPDQVGGSYDDRAAKMLAKRTAEIAAGAAGFLAWNWEPLGSALDSYAIGAGDPSLDSLRSTNPGVAMTATDGAFGGASEAVGGSFSAPTPPGAYTVCVTGVDIYGNASDGNACTALTVDKVAQSITFAAIGTKALSASPITVAPSASSGLPVTMTSNSTSVCTVDGYSVTLVANGTCSLTASQSGNLVYKAATSVTRTFLVNKSSQTITFANPGAQTLLTSPVALSATASSGLAVTFTSETTAVCTVSGTTLALLTQGSCIVDANQAGDATYAAAPTVKRTIAINAVKQTITFPNPGGQTLDASPIDLSASASSGLAVGYASNTPAVCTISGHRAILVALGSCSVTASQAGNATYAPASLQRTFMVKSHAQTIAFPNPGKQSLLVPTVLVSATASSGLPVTVNSSSTNVCTISGDTVTLLQAGQCSLTATQGGSAAFTAAPQVTRAFTVAASYRLPFVVANGTALKVAGAKFVFNGAAVYHASSGNPQQTPEQAIALASQAGLNTVRLTDIFDQSGDHPNDPFRESSWVTQDEIIARARGAGMRVVLDLSSFRNFLVNRDIRTSGVDCSSGGHRTADDYAAVDPYRPALESEWEAFFDFVVNRVNTFTGVRYGGDATIAVISIAGEPHGSGTEDCGKATSPADLTQFYRRTLGYLASIDSNHLRSNGGLTQTDWQQVYGGTADSGIDGEAIFALADNTLPSLHTYPAKYANDGTPIDYQTPHLGAFAIAHGKPWFTEEFGWPQDQTFDLGNVVITTNDATRARYYQWLYDEQGTYGSAGALLWNLGNEIGPGTYDTGPGTPKTWAVVKAN